MQRGWNTPIQPEYAAKNSLEYQKKYIYIYITWKRQQVINELEYTKNIQKYHNIQKESKY